MIPSARYVLALAVNVALPHHGLAATLPVDHPPVFN